MTEKPPSRVADQFVVRLPDGMRDQIAEAAKANNRSMNAEIVARLQASFAGQPLSPTEVMGLLAAAGIGEAGAQGATPAPKINDVMFSRSRKQTPQDPVKWDDEEGAVADPKKGSGGMLVAASRWLRIRTLERRNATLQLDLSGAEKALSDAELARERVDPANDIERRRAVDQLIQVRVKVQKLREELAKVGAELNVLYEAASGDAPGAGSLGRPQE